MVNFTTQIPDCDCQSPAFLDLFISADGSICSAMAQHLLGKSENVLVSNSIGFPSNSKWDSPFHCIAYDYSCTDWGSLCNHLAEVSFQDIFKLSASAAASQFCVQIEVRIDIYIYIYVSLIISIRSSFTHLHGFQLLMLLLLLPQFIHISFLLISTE